MKKRNGGGDDPGKKGSGNGPKKMSGGAVAGADKGTKKVDGGYKKGTSPKVGPKSVSPATRISATLTTKPSVPYSRKEDMTGKAAGAGSIRGKIDKLAKQAAASEKKNMYKGGKVTKKK